MNRAFIKDIEKQYIDAVKFYEEEIRGSNVPDVDCFINLAFLYWSFATEQIEFNDPNNIPDEWSVIGEKNFLPTIDKGLKNYPDHLELVFWRRYLSHRLYFTSDFTENDCKAILETNRNQGVLVPYFFLYLFDKEAYADEIVELRRVCNELPTAKNLYISTFIGK
ncbi:hypothetical protein VRU48_00720 [Pedobacter sp. KR3-3]|uniref:Uncharacterized protein n=1 Tax=Pedobacter albus TaxID=3113905 RepID=A0ABU7I2C0_9SPHI|nr:hypothetical protein [Pedobacter sp. KR3-3]MEE1943608.1 hypothetical protein [Pedobacter sp. KR3-3]